MTNNTDNEADTAVTVLADNNIKEMLKSGTMEEIQEIVQEGKMTFPSRSSCFSWSKGQIVGKYEIIRKIGKGGMGVIYLARHTQLETLRALKVLPVESTEDNPVFAERFIREARIASQIRHPNVVEVMDVETDPDLNVSYIVMEYVDGGSLRQVLKGQSKLNIEQAIITIQSVASALSIAAEHGIVHRDIKPDNIMFTRNGTVKLADLGIAKKDDEDDNLTKTNVMMGTPAYLSPEQVENPKTVDIRSDIYSLGATFYEMLTGQPPYPGKTSFDIIRKMFAEPVPDPRSINPEIPEEIATVIMKMLAKEPQKRYQSPSQLLDALSEMIPNVSNTSIQQIVKSIVNLKNDGTPEYTCNSIFTGTICNMRKQRLQKRIIIWACCGLCLGLCILLGCFLMKDSTEKTQSVIEERAETNTKPENETAVEPAGPVLHNLRIKTTPFSTVRLINSNGQILSYAGNSSGMFNISDLEPGKYEIEISRADFVTYKKECTVPAEKMLELILTPDVKTLEVTGIPDSKIELQCPDGRSRTYTIPKSGTIRIENLKKGDYFLKAVHKEYVDAEKRLRLDNDSQIKLQMEKIFKVVSVLTLPGSQVELLQNSEIKYMQKTDPKGKNLFAKVRGGVYELKISAPRYKTHSAILHVEKDTEISVPLEKSLYTLTVYGAAGTKAEVYFGTRIVRRFDIPASGNIVLNNLEQGAYSIHFSRKGYLSQKQQINILENITLQVSLEQEPEPVSKTTVSVEPVKGTVNIYLSAPQNVMNHIKKYGIDIQIGETQWKKIKDFPLVYSAEAGETEIKISGKGIKTDNRTISVVKGKSSDVLIDIQVEKSKAVFTSNQSNVLFYAGEKKYSVGEEILLDPFKEYLITAKFEDQTAQKKFRSDIPGEDLKIEFMFIKRTHPMQKQYETACKLFREEDYENALEIFLAAAKAKHPDAAFQVAVIYEKGLGMWFSDKFKAMEWYYNAATYGNVDAALIIASAIYEDDYDGTPEQMLKFYLMAVDKNNPEITYLVSNFYKNGYKTIRQDDEKALLYLKKAAEAGYPDAMFDLGLRYEKGMGVPLNMKTALEWIRKAAEKGHEKASRYQEQYK